MPALVAARMDFHHGPFVLTGAWQIGGDDPAVGNYSALGVLADGDLVSLSDRGALLTMTRPDRPGPWRVRNAPLFPRYGAFAATHSDGEALIVLPPHDDYLMMMESTPDVLRFSHDLRGFARITIPALAAWPDNLGPEASARLRDGRTVMIEEGYRRWWDRTGHDALIFPGLPRDGESPAHCSVIMPAGWRPTELTAMPDGTLLLLERKVTPRGFLSAIAVIDPLAIRPGATVRPRTVATITEPAIRDNYEGMTITRERDGALILWVISDSNAMVWLQRTLLLKFRIVQHP